MAGIEIGLVLYGLMVGLGAGVIGGTLAGLAGVGGGLIYVPIFYLFMPSDSGALAMHVFASMVAIVATGYFSARSHKRLGHVDSRSMLALLPGLVIAAALGLWSTLQIPYFIILFGLAALNGWVAFDYGRALHPRARHDVSLQLFSWPIGYVSGLLGIGGGTMLVPLLRRYVTLRQAVGTSAMCGLFMILSALILNLTLEPEWWLLISRHAEFLIGAWAGILLVLPYSSGWASRLHTTLPEATLRDILRTVFVVLAMALLGAALLGLAMA